MNTRVAEQMQQSKEILSDRIIDALTEFTEETGCFISGLSFHTEKIDDSEGHPDTIIYHDVEPQLW